MDETHRHEEESERPSRSQRRRDALAMLDLAERLASLPPARLDALGLPEDVREALATLRPIAPHGARKRQLAYLAKCMRRHDDAVFAAARAALGADRERRQQQAAAFRRLEVWRERLLKGDRSELTALLGQYPQLDGQHLRSLIRQARRERERGKPPRAARELLRLLRGLPSA